MSFRQALTASISALVACAVTLTACDIPVSSIPNIPEPSGGGQGQALPQPDFTANLELNRSLLIRGDTQQGSAVATARANSIATFEWCVDEVAPDDTVEPCTTGSAAAIAARSLLDLDIPPTFFNSEGRLIESRFTDPNVATSELQRSTLTIRKVNGDPGPTGSWIRITVATTLVQGAGDADDRFILSGTCDDGAACDVQAQDCADASVCEPVRTTRTRLLKIVRPPSELAVSISAGSARVSPDGSVELAATISGGTPFVEGEGDGTTATVPCDRYCIEWTPDESRLSPEVIRPAGEEIISIKPLPPFDPSGTGQTVSTVVYTAPKAVGSVTFRVDVTDKRGNHATDTVAITVSSETALGIAEASSSGGEDGRAQLAPGDNTTLTIRAAAGEAPYTVTLTILNTGLLGGSLSQSSCTIGSSDDERAQGCSVTYRAPIDKVGTALINVTIEDAVGATESTIISLPVSAPLNLSVTLAEEGSGVEPRQTVPILATIVGGTPPYTACYLVPTGHGSVGGGSADCGPITIGDDTFGACTCGLGDPTQHGLSLFEEERNFTAPGARDSVPIRVAVQDVVGKRATDILTMLVSSSATPPPNVTPGPGPLTSLDAHATNPNVCLAQTTDIQATATGGTAPYTFTFSIAGVPVAGESVTPPSVSQSSPTATATYTAPTTDSTPRKVRVTVDEAGGTSQTSEVQITPPGLPSADAGADLQACATELVPVGAVPTASGGKPPYTYTWTAVDRAAPGNVLPSTVFDNSSASNPKFIPGVAAAGNGTSYDISVEVKDACGKTVVDVARIDVNRSSCDDGNDCTANVCSGGACTNPMLADGTACADDGNVCTDDVCRIGTCEHENNSASCDDGNACTTNDTCANGACVGGAPPDCDDANVCTDDSCDPATGCTHDDNTAPCDDGNACTTSDTCAGGACVGGAPPNCDDNNVCTTDFCNQAGGCTHLDNTNSCDDGNACTTNDTCANGACVGGAPPDCDDGNLCTDDACDPVLGCTHTNNDLPCSDGNACTENDTCAGGACVGGAAPDCDDNNVCTIDFCSQVDGCTHLNNNNPCDDGDACTVGDICAGGVCTAGAPADCGDGNVCTDDACDPILGCTHTNNDLPCSDGNACTENDACAGGVCVGGPAVDCDDNNVCTIDFCSQVDGCTHLNNNNPCDDGNACTVGDTCSGGSCIPGSPVDCSDGVACTDDACDQVTGCSHTPNNAACDDGDVCTDDVCDVNTGCTHTNNTAPCDDADACTTNDMCSNGACVGVPPPALVVDAGADMTVLLGDPVLLNGTACDPDFATGALLPLWEVTVADCPVSSIVVSNPFAFVTSVDVQETCTFDLRLTVTNPNSNSAEDFLTVTVNLCGDGVCNLTEDCGSCPQDCPCPDGFICDAGACVCVTGCR